MGWWGKDDTHNGTFSIDDGSIIPYYYWDAPDAGGYYYFVEPDGTYTYKKKSNLFLNYKNVQTAKDAYPYREHQAGSFSGTQIARGLNATIAEWLRTECEKVKANLPQVEETLQQEETEQLADEEEIEDEVDVETPPASTRVEEPATVVTPTVPARPTGMMGMTNQLIWDKRADINGHKDQYSLDVLNRLASLTIAHNQNNTARKEALLVKDPVTGELLYTAKDKDDYNKFVDNRYAKQLADFDNADNSYYTNRALATDAAGWGRFGLDQIKTANGTTAGNLRDLRKYEGAYDNAAKYYSAPDAVDLAKMSNKDFINMKRIIRKTAPLAGGKKMSEMFTMAPTGKRDDIKKLALYKDPTLVGQDFGVEGLQNGGLLHYYNLFEK